MNTSVLLNQSTSLQSNPTRAQHGSSRARVPLPFKPQASPQAWVARACTDDCPHETSRRQLLVSPLVVSGLALLSSVPAGALAEEAAVLEPPAPASTSGKMAELVDDILAYKFEYPVSTISGKPLKMLLSHPPEKYSSAAPLTADARQRIVSELLDLRNFISVSMTVGPASGVLKGVDVDQWKPYDVALTVLVDRSTSRMTTGQRMSLNDVESAVTEVRDGGAKYFVFEHLSQGSPTALENDRKETYRHALAATAVRPDGQGVPYMYTLNLSCRQEMWDDLEPLFKEAIASYRLLPPTANYVSPDTNPWQFW